MGLLLKICLKPSEIRHTKCHNCTSIAVIWIFFLPSNLEDFSEEQGERVYKDTSIMGNCYQGMLTNYSWHLKRETPSTYKTTASAKAFIFSCHP
jgi:hypothetical protein